MRHSSPQAIVRLRSARPASRVTTLELLEGRELLAGDLGAAMELDYRPGVFARPTPIDATVNGELVRISVQATDLVGNPIASIFAGSDFLLQADVQDIREPANPIAGVFSAWLNVSYDSALATIDPAAVLSFDPFFDLAQTFDVSTPGAVNGAGAFTSSLAPPGNAAQKLWTAPVHATSAGLVTFTPSFDASPLHEVFLYDPVAALLAEQIEFVGATLEIVAPPEISVNDVSAAEGDANLTDFVFSVSLSEESADVVTVAFATSDGTATVADNDYQATSGTLTFLPFQTLQLVTVKVVGDVALEADETFLLELSNPAGATLAANSGLGTILNDDVAPPAISVNDVSLLEGDVGDTFFEFTISLSEPSAGPVSVAFSSADGTATAGVDYLATSGTVVIPAAQTQAVVTVEVLGDTFVEPDETFFLNLSEPVGATLADPQGKGTILDDDGLTLILNGTDRRDRVTVIQWGKRLHVRSNFGNTTVNNVDSLVKIIFYLEGGDDRLIVNSNVKVPIIAHGGPGNDLLKAGGGPSVLLGEEGNDRLIGGNARDILIGGLGADLLMGGLGEDILINGTTNFDLDDMALWELMDVWNNDNIYEARIRQVRELPLIVTDDLDPDRLVGSFGRDWFFYDALLDTIPDRKSNEALN